MNQLKTALLMLGLTALMLFVGELVGGQYGIVMGLGFALVSNLFAYFLSDKIVLALYRARPLTPQDNHELCQIVEQLAQEARIPMPRLYLIPGSMVNAFATGRNPQNAAVAVTEGILQTLDARELRGVLAHEISHVLNRDILISTIAAIIAGAVYSLARIAEWSLWWGGGRRDDERGGHPAGLLLVAILAPMAALLIQMAISRSREYDADQKGAHLSHDPLALAQALAKIHEASRQSRWQPNPTTAHLFISNPLRGRDLLSIFSTHPPTEKRIARLEALARDMGQQTPGPTNTPNMPRLIY